MVTTDFIYTSFGYDTLKEDQKVRVLKKVRVCTSVLTLASLSHERKQNVLFESNATGCASIMCLPLN